VNCRPSQTELDGFRYRPRRKLGRFVGGGKCRIVDGNWIRKQNAMVGTGRFELPTPRTPSSIAIFPSATLNRPELLYAAQLLYFPDTGFVRLDTLTSSRILFRLPTKVPTNISGGIQI
jgi:hypothetical protein